jgi:hypothetical protein
MRLFDNGFNFRGGLPEGFLILAKYFAEASKDFYRNKQTLTVNYVTVISRK